VRAVIVYESIYGNTLEIAEAIAAGLRGRAEVSVLPVSEADPSGLGQLDLLVVGGPTHVRGLSRGSTRERAIADAPGKGLRTVAGKGDPGLREWLAGLTDGGFAVAAFDTRLKAPAMVTGRASLGIARRLRRHGLSPLTSATSFFVNRNNQLLAGETDRARRWGRDLAELATKQAGRTGGRGSDPARRA
jgi:hypothetical protein